MLGLLAGTLGQPYWYHLILFKSATRPEEPVAVWLQMMCSDMNDMIGCWPKKSNMSTKYILLALAVEDDKTSYKQTAVLLRLYQNKNDKWVRVVSK